MAVSLDGLPIVPSYFAGYLSSFMSFYAEQNSRTNGLSRSISLPIFVYTRQPIKSGKMPVTS